MKKYFNYLTAILLFGALFSLNSCKEDETPVDVDPGQSTSELLVKKPPLAVTSALKMIELTFDTPLDELFQWQANESEISEA